MLFDRQYWTVEVNREIVKKNTSNGVVSSEPKSSEVLPYDYTFSERSVENFSRGN